MNATSRKENLTNYLFLQHVCPFKPTCSQSWCTASSRCLSHLQVLGLWGMGGIGKTTLASALFNHLQPAFADASCFLAEIRSQSSDGYFRLQRRLLKAITGADPEVHDAGEGAAKGRIGTLASYCHFIDSMHASRVLQCLEAS